MQQSNLTPDPSLEDWFALLRPIPTRDQAAAARGKQVFMAQVRSLPAPVSGVSFVRHIWWIDFLKQFINNKEYSPMYVTLASIVVALSLLLGGTGATVYAAQDSLPNQALYRVKTLSEDLALNLSLQNQQKLQLELEYANRRVAEMISLAESGEIVPEAVLKRMELHMDRALGLAANVDRGEMTSALIRLQARLRQQIKALEGASQVGPVMVRAQAAIRTRLRWVEFGISEPNEFRHQARVRNQFQQMPGFGGGTDPGSGPGPDQVPQGGSYGPGPNLNQDQEPGSPGPGPNVDQDPVENGTGPHSNPDPGSDQGNDEPGPKSNGDQEPNYDSSPGSGPGPNQESGNSDPGPGSDPESKGKDSGPDDPGCCTDGGNGPNDGDNGSNTNQVSGDGLQHGNGGKP